MKKTLIITPTIFEAEPILSELGATEKSYVGDCIERDSIVCLISGIGCERSAERVKTAIEKYTPEVVILAGFCGACNKSFANGDLIYETSSQTLSIIASKLRGTRGKIACVEKIADTNTAANEGNSAKI